MIDSPPRWRFAPREANRRTIEDDGAPPVVQSKLPILIFCFEPGVRLEFYPGVTCESETAAADSKAGRHAFSLRSSFSTIRVLFCFS